MLSKNEAWECPVSAELILVSCLPLRLPLCPSVCLLGCTSWFSACHLGACQYNAVINVVWTLLLLLPLTFLQVNMYSTCSIWFTASLNDTITDITDHINHYDISSTSMAPRCLKLLCVSAWMFKGRFAALLKVIHLRIKQTYMWDDTFVHAYMCLPVHLLSTVIHNCDAHWCLCVSADGMLSSYFSFLLYM